MKIVITDELKNYIADIRNFNIIVCKLSYK